MLPASLRGRGLRFLRSDGSRSSGCRVLCDWLRMGIRFFGCSPEDLRNAVAPRTTPRTATLDSWLRSPPADAGSVSIWHRLPDEPVRVRTSQSRCRWQTGSLVGCFGLRRFCVRLGQAPYCGCLLVNSVLHGGRGFSASASCIGLLCAVRTVSWPAGSACCLLRFGCVPLGQRRQSAHAGIAGAGQRLLRHLPR